MKTLKNAILILAAFFMMSASVDAKTYTNKDVEAKLDFGVNYVNSLIDDNIYYSVDSSDIKIIKTSTTGKNYVTEIKYQDGVYTFNSKFPSVSTTEEQIQNAYDGLAMMAFMSAVVSIYTTDTATSVASVVVKDTLTNDHLTEADHGIVFTDEPLEEVFVDLDNGSSLATNSIIRTVKIDLNNQKFQKLATTLENENNPLNLIIQLDTKGPSDEPSNPDVKDPTTPTNPTEPSNPSQPTNPDEPKDPEPTTPKDPEGNKEENANQNAGASNTGSTNSQEKPQESTTVENPHTGIKNLFGLLIISILCFPLLKWLNTKNLFSQL